MPNLLVLGKILLNFLGMLWLRMYILNMVHYLAASTSSLWYFTANDKHLSTKVMIWQTFKEALRYHNGSIALGAVLLFFFEPMGEVFKTIYVNIIKKN